MTISTFFSHLRSADLAALVLAFFELILTVWFWRVSKRVVVAAENWFLPLRTSHDNGRTELQEFQSAQALMRGVNIFIIMLFVADASIVLSAVFASPAILIATTVISGFSITWASIGWVSVNNTVSRMWR